MSEKLFETAARKKFRFPSVKGVLTVEQLFDLPLTAANGFCLDAVAKEINSELKSVSEESFVAVASNPQKGVLEDKLEIVKHVIGVKQAENAARVAAADKAEQRERLRQILRDKKDKSLEGLSEAELEARLDALG